MNKIKMISFQLLIYILIYLAPFLTQNVACVSNTYSFGGYRYDIGLSSISKDADLQNASFRQMRELKRRSYGLICRGFGQVFCYTQQKVSLLTFLCGLHLSHL